LTYQWFRGATSLTGETNSDLNIAAVTTANAGTYTVVITNPCQEVTSATAEVIINTVPTIETQPVGTTICEGEGINLSVSATGTDLTYQWSLNGTPLAGATAATYAVAVATLAEAGNYSVAISGACTSAVTPPVTSEEAIVVVNQGVDITSQPQASTTLCEGETLALSVTATGTNLTYQWFRGATSLTGETNSDLNIAAVATANAGIYTVVITNPCQEVTSAAAEVIINTVPTITTQPVGTTICEGEGINLSVTATGTDLTYQWSLNGTPLAGATAATYAVPVATLAEAGNYSVAISGACTSAVTPPVISEEAIVVVNQGVDITSQPQASTTLCEGETLALSVTAEGTNLTYQWFRGATSLTGETNSDLNIAAVTTANAGTYTVVITNPCQEVTSATAEVIINTVPTIETQPVGTTICEGEGINLSVTATGTALTYQWSLNGTPLAGATAATYAVAVATLAEAGNYSVTISGACTSAVTPPVISNAALVVVNQGAAFTIQPEAITIVCSDENVTLTAAIAGGTGATYQWFQGSTAISGATALTYTISVSTVANSGNYTLQVTVASCGTITSEIAVVVVNQAPGITSQPQSREICVGQTTTFTVVATGTNLTYQWYKGTTAIAGATATASSYTISGATEADSGDYYCIIKSTSCPDIQTDTVTLLVKPLPTATIAPGTASSICAGESAEIIFNGTAGAVVIYTINGGTQETLTLNTGIATILPTGNLDETTVYELVSVTYTGPDACSQTLNGSATIIVNPLPRVALEDGTICIDPITLATTRNYLLNTGLNEANFTFEWFDVNGTIPLATNSFYDVSVVGQYGVTITDIQTGCQAGAFANVDSSSPPLDFNYTVSGFFADNPTIVITATPFGDYEYQLDFGPFQESNVFDNITAGSHTISVRDPEACDVLTKEVLIVDYPRYFTPNGDGINDNWTISSIAGVSITKINIFDRFGRLLKQLSTSGLGWDGTFNGESLPATDYWFTINYQETGVEKEYRAHFSLKR
jgi:gliding motility-associated-like protein